ncbi:MAG: nickel-dependent lactate racemase [Desulfarculaceae bacterium]|nr:nickel-dependent lactate racemase [Desulfarculaceae bacterium]MCF8071568.1 nickel-dependent lactate racemase [Desulfarculaceae bacterium]MCF8102383.1 nickel-dependent lactate racemase [Desulfarculaceae bacterium]MCF8114847.1 nickel-dependent lactate racemase [Desulfarculaceae bacterium]
MNFPRLMRIRQTMPDIRLQDIAGEVRRQVASMDLGAQLKPGQSVAITAGSRGISNLPLVLATLVEEFKALGAEPFLVPAMGSHGGATAEGQITTLRELGITPETVGAPIRSSMETVRLAATSQGVPVFLDKHASQADHVVVVNRVKPHTVLSGEVESGLHKMLLIGLGKQEGADSYHRAFHAHSFDAIARTVGQAVIREGKVLMGLALVENAFKHTAVIEAVRPRDFWEREKDLLVKAKELLPHLPFDQADLLIIDEFGKNISGSGMDTNVVGRKPFANLPPEQVRPRINAIYVRDLTPASHGNATGIGRTDLAHSRLIEKIDWPATYMNCLTANAPGSASMPMHFASDHQSLVAALPAVMGGDDPSQALVMRIKNTMELEEALVSEAYLDQARERGDLEILGPAEELIFDDQGDLLPW